MLESLISRSDGPRPSVMAAGPGVVTAAATEAMRAATVLDDGHDELLALLAQHLLELGAPRASARLIAHRNAAGLVAAVAPIAGRQQPAHFELAETDLVAVVYDSASAAAFSAAVDAACAGPLDVAFDAEWQPDTTKEEHHAPSLVQVAIRVSHSSGTTRLRGLLLQ